MTLKQFSEFLVWGEEYAKEQYKKHKKTSITGRSGKVYNCHLETETWAEDMLFSCNGIVTDCFGDDDTIDSIEVSWQEAFDVYSETDKFKIQWMQQNLYTGK
jgi:hypothetical protein